MGAVHEVPGLVPAPALNVQKNSNGGALTVGTSAFVTHSLVQREAEADPALLYGAYGYGLGYAGYHGLGYSGYYGYPSYGGHTNCEDDRENLCLLPSWRCCGFVLLLVV